MPSFERACVVDVMRPGVMSCQPDASIVEVAQTMATHHIHCVVVGGVAMDAVHGEELVWGLISDMDLVTATGDRETVKAREIARTDAVSVDVTASLADAARLMRDRGTAHLVATSGGRPVGVLSSLDIAGAIAWGRA